MLGGTRLRKIGAKFLARWDASGPHYPHHCHHEKSWLVDAGTESEVRTRPAWKYATACTSHSPHCPACAWCEQVVFTGGMGVNPGTVLATPEHLIAPKSYHDVIVELVGPSATDLVRTLARPMLSPTTTHPWHRAPATIGL